ncbi:MAG: carbohydrate ABC transporter permease [Chloroflexi bacterium]|nr:MAG: carbohydrate ABC transporter permease [Chloroflexota bacterium]
MARPGATGVVVRRAVRREPTIANRIVSVIDRSAIHFVLALVALIWLVPTVGLLITSFRPRSDIQATGWWDIAQLHLTSENYQQVLQAQGMFEAFLNTVFIAVPSTLLPLAICSLAAYAFSWMNFPFRDTIFLIIVGLLMVPVQVAFIPVLTLFRELVPQLELTRGYVAIWLAHTAFALPFGIFLLRNFFITLPGEMIEASRIDGASDVQIFRSVILPVTVPAIAAYGIFQFLWVWNDLLMALVFVQDSSKYPMTRAVLNLLSQYGTEWHLLAAGAFLVMVVPVIVFFSLQRYFVQGLLAGSIK